VQILKFIPRILAEYPQLFYLKKKKQGFSQALALVGAYSTLDNFDILHILYVHDPVLRWLYALAEADVLFLICDTFA
jgi:hypothetical protein